MSQWKIPLFDSDIGKAEIAEVVKVLESRWLTMGDVTKKFEAQFCTLTGSKYAFAVSNGTTALHLANVLLNICPGDEVIVPSLTFVATVNSILYMGATPVFADISSETDLNISPEDIERKITPKTKAIIVVHYAGYPCNMEKITAIAKRYNLSLIEDVAHAPGAAINGKSCGTFGDCGCFSFFSNKNLATGEGGMIITNNDEFAIKLKLLRSHGMTTLTLDRYRGHAFSYDVLEMGYNYRISEIASAIGTVQLEKLSSKNKRREELVNLYNVQLLKVNKITVPFQNFMGKSSYHIFPILLDRSIDRQTFMEYMNLNGIQTSIHYPPVHQFTFHKRLSNLKTNLPITEDVAKREVTLPLFPQMKDSDVDKITDCIKNFVNRN
jgi:dTDP-4-amino-4,6-dideoxygalactose transaminase